MQNIENGRELKSWQTRNANLAVYTELGLNILFRMQIKSHIYDSLSNLKSYTEMKEFHIKEPLYIFFYSMKEIYEFCKSETVKVYKLKLFLRLCNTSHY